MGGEVIEYLVQPQGKVLQAYNDCRDRVSIIIGPLGSGKTIQTSLKILDLMCEQKPVRHQRNKNFKKRLTRWLAVRNTYSELFSTTIKDWMSVHEDIGVFKGGGKEPPNQQIEFKLEDDTIVKSEIIFIAFDRPDHVRKIRGHQVTGIWLNEVKELEKAVIDMLDLRHGRYPSKKEGSKPTWHGMLGDTNAPDDDHWLYKFAEEIKPKNWSFYRQPGAVYKDGDQWRLNPLAENINNLEFDYYEAGLEGKDEDWIKVNLANEYGFVSDGKPVHPRYVDSLHCQDINFTPDKESPIVLGFDFGRTPACAFIQKVPVIQRWVMFDEFMGSNMSAATFAPELKLYIDNTYPGFEFKGWGDPSGGSGGQATDDTAFRIVRTAGIPCNPTETNNVEIRRASLENPMKEIAIDGKPRFMLLPKCKVTRKGLKGGFCYKRIQVTGEKYKDEPDKNMYSHICEGLEYALQGEGEGRSALVTPSMASAAPITADISFEVFD